MRGDEGTGTPGTPMCVSVCGSSVGSGFTILVAVNCFVTRSAINTSSLILRGYHCGIFHVFIDIYD